MTESPPSKAQGPDLMLVPEGFYTPIQRSFFEIEVIINARLQAI